MNISNISPILLAFVTLGSFLLFVMLLVLPTLLEKGHKKKHTKNK